jgi:hypothetical protein
MLRDEEREKKLAQQEKEPPRKKWTCWFNDAERGMRCSKMYYNMAPEWSYDPRDYCKPKEYKS